MSGKLPIDRVREAEDAPRVYEEQKQRFSEKQAKLRDLGSGREDDQHTPSEVTSEEGDDA